MSSSFLNTTLLLFIESLSHLTRLSKTARWIRSSSHHSEKWERCVCAPAILSPRAHQRKRLCAIRTGMFGMCRSAVTKQTVKPKLARVLTEKVNKLYFIPAVEGESVFFYMKIDWFFSPSRMRMLFETVDGITNETDGWRIPSQPANDVRTKFYGRCYDVKTLEQRRYDVRSRLSW